ncbi:helix-turn-helix domain-containing protein [Niastella caeni]|uniref:Helix-turn-helix domain-containing protein n=1 Tax=Niastella caeni TaxID=2569763 RepID=A0A4S8HV54_9BACT|nr:AraC family transcriptional regulator [Niastella caeni]THU39493.1 helix-turn-helix domain-containing protein [Niastella caeni]
MKPIVQKLPLKSNKSFVAATFRSPNFETGWHQHMAHELILFTEGQGHVRIGKHVGNFKTGDIYFLGSNLPHQFQQKDKSQISAIIIHFEDDCWGKDFLNLPECHLIKQLLDISTHGLQITDTTTHQLHLLIKSLETAIDGNRIILLLQCLQLMASAKPFAILSSKEIHNVNHSDKDCIDRIYKYTSNTFHEPVSLSDVAAIACKSVPSFCHYFKRRTQKTYITYLNEVRIGYACHQLLQTDKPVTDIGYESGYNTVAYFHRQFLRLKKITPLQYRKLKAVMNM